MSITTFGRMRWAVSICAVFGCLTVAQAQATGVVSSGNLLQNPGAEAGFGPENGSGVMPPADWTAAGQMTVVKYEEPGGFPSLSVAASIGGGTSFFGGGDAELSSAAQVIDVSSSASTIDAGAVAATLSGDLGGYESQNDSATLTATYLSAAGATLGSLTIGPVTEAERKGVTSLLPKSATGAVPAGTRSIKVVMTSTRVEGSYDDGYLDNLSLSLAPATATVTETAVPGTRGIVTAPPNTQCLSRRAFTIHIRQLAGLTPYRQVAVFVRGHRVSVTHGARLSAPINLRGLPKGRYTVRITVTTNAGKQLTGTRSYRTCTPKSGTPKGTPKL